MSFSSIKRASRRKATQASITPAGALPFCLLVLPLLSFQLFLPFCLLVLPFQLLRRIIVRQQGLDKVVVKWPDEDKEVVHELNELKPAPEPGSVLTFPKETVVVVDYIDTGEHAHIARLRKNIPKGAPVCGRISHVRNFVLKTCGRILHVSDELKPCVLVKIETCVSVARYCMCQTN